MQGTQGNDGNQGIQGIRGGQGNIGPKGKDAFINEPLLENRITENIIKQMKDGINILIEN